MSRQALPEPQQALPPVMQEPPSGTHASHCSLPVQAAGPGQELPVAGSAQVRPLQQAAVGLHPAPTGAQDWHVPPTQESPRQQSAVAVHACARYLHESQTHPAPPVQSVPSDARHESAGLWLQHCAVAVQDCSCDWQVGGTAHFPARQLSVVVGWAGSKLQQSAFTEQLAPVAAQALAEVQVPLVAPGGIVQARPVQQSPFVVQAPVAFTQGAAQTPPRQLLEQQSLATEQDCPLLLHDVGVLQLKALTPSKVHTVPAQQLASSVPWQAPFSGVQDGTVQRSTPCASGTHGAKLQHWSRNWQTPPAVAVPAGMQQAGLFASQPVGQLGDPPPKQRQMKFASCLQTAFLPSQNTPYGLATAPGVVGSEPPQHEAVRSQ